MTHVKTKKKEIEIYLEYERKNTIEMMQYNKNMQKN